MDAGSDSDCVQVDCTKLSSLASLPFKSRSKYEAAYKSLMDWKEANKKMSLSEDVVLAYFLEMAKNLKPSTLWAWYSMLKLTLNINNGVDLDGYLKLKEFLKKRAKEHVPVEMKKLSMCQIKKFIQDAPDEDYLLLKVALIMAVVGGCRKRELYHITTSNIEDFGTGVLVTIPQEYSRMPRKFTIKGEFYAVFKKYANLRPPDCEDSHFFLGFLKGKCAIHRTGINKFGLLGKQVAKFLKLPNAVLYKGYCFRQSSDSFLGEDVTLIGSKSNERAKDQYAVNTMINYSNVAVTSRKEDYDEGGSPVFKGFSNSLPNTPSLPSTLNFSSIPSVHSTSETETNDRSYSISEDPLAEETYQFDDEDDDSDAEEKDFSRCDVTQTEILQNEVDPFTNSECANSKECDLFGEYIAKHLQLLPIEMALKLQSGIQALVLKTRLEYFREHPSEASAMVKEEWATTNTTPSREEPSSNDKRVQNGVGKRSQKSDPQQPASKRFKSNHSSPTSTKHPQQNQIRRTEYTVFAEHIALQLEQLPEDVSIQLQTEIYDLITQTYSKHTDDDDIISRAKIKTEILEVDAELFDL